jgi:hypothetical protein
MGVEAAGRDLEDLAPAPPATGDEMEEPGEEADPYTLAPGAGPHRAHGRRPAVRRAALRA